MYSVRIVNVDHYMSSPIQALDPTYSEFRGSDVKQVPVIRIFGTSPGGIKSLVHVHGVFPYICVPFDGSESYSKLAYQLAASLDKAINITLGKSNSQTQHVYKVVLVSGIPFYGYHSKEHQFFKIYFYKPSTVKQAVNLLQNGAILNKIFQPHEAHVPFILQFFIDFNLYGMSFIQFSHIKFRRNGNEDLIPNVSEELLLPPAVLPVGVSQLEGDVLAADILNRNTLSGGRQTANPGLAAIWEDECRRRAADSGTPQKTPQLHSQRPSNPPTASDIFYRERLREKLATVSVSDEESSLSGGASSNPLISYPAETPAGSTALGASFLSLHVVRSDSSPTSHNVPHPFKIPHDTIVDEDLVLKMSQTMNKSVVLDNEDINLLAVLENLEDIEPITADNDSVLGSQKQAKSQCLSTGDSADENSEEEDNKWLDTTVVDDTNRQLEVDSSQVGVSKSKNVLRHRILTAENHRELQPGPSGLGKLVTDSTNQSDDSDSDNLWNDSFWGNTSVSQLDGISNDGEITAAQPSSSTLFRIPQLDGISNDGEITTAQPSSSTSFRVPQLDGADDIPFRPVRKSLGMRRRKVQQIAQGRMIDKKEDDDANNYGRVSFLNSSDPSWQHPSKQAQWRSTVQVPKTPKPGSSGVSSVNCIDIDGQDILVSPLVHCSVEGYIPIFCEPQQQNSTGVPVSRDCEKNPNASPQIEFISTADSKLIIHADCSADSCNRCSRFTEKHPEEIQDQVMLKIGKEESIIPDHALEASEVESTPSGTTSSSVVTLDGAVQQSETCDEVGLDLSDEPPNSHFVPGTTPPHSTFDSDDDSTLGTQPTLENTLDFVGNESQLPVIDNTLELTTLSGRENELHSDGVIEIQPLLACCTSTSNCDQESGMELNLDRVNCDEFIDDVVSCGEDSVLRGDPSLYTEPPSDKDILGVWNSTDGPEDIGNIVDELLYHCSGIPASANLSSNHPSNCVNISPSFNGSNPKMWKRSSRLAVNTDVVPAQTVSPEQKGPEASMCDSEAYDPTINMSPCSCDDITDGGLLSASCYDQLRVSLGSLCASRAYCGEGLSIGGALPCANVDYVLESENATSSCPDTSKDELTLTLEAKRLRQKKSDCQGTCSKARRKMNAAPDFDGFDPISDAILHRGCKPTPGPPPKVEDSRVYRSRGKDMELVAQFSSMFPYPRKRRGRKPKIHHEAEAKTMLPETQHVRKQISRNSVARKLTLNSSEKVDTRKKYSVVSNPTEEGKGIPVTRKSRKKPVIPQDQNKTSAAHSDLSLSLHITEKRPVTRLSSKNSSCQGSLSLSPHLIENANTKTKEGKKITDGDLSAACVATSSERCIPKTRKSLRKQQREWRRRKLSLSAQTKRTEAQKSSAIFPKLIPRKLETIYSSSSSSKVQECYVVLDKITKQNVYQVCKKFGVKLGDRNIFCSRITCPHPVVKQQTSSSTLSSPSLPPSTSCRRGRPRLHFPPPSDIVTQLHFEMAKSSISRRGRRKQSSKTTKKEISFVSGRTPNTSSGAKLSQVEVLSNQDEINCLLESSEIKVIKSRSQEKETIQKPALETTRSYDSGVETVGESSSSTHSNTYEVVCLDTKSSSLPEELQDDSSLISLECSDIELSLSGDESIEKRIHSQNIKSGVKKEPPLKVHSEVDIHAGIKSPIGVIGTMSATENPPLDCKISDGNVNWVKKVAQRRRSFHEQFKNHTEPSATKSEIFSKGNDDSRQAKTSYLLNSKTTSSQGSHQELGIFVSIEKCNKSITRSVIHCLDGAADSVSSSSSKSSGGHIFSQPSQTCGKRRGSEELGTILSKTSRLLPPSTKSDAHKPVISWTQVYENEPLSFMHWSPPSPCPTRMCSPPRPLSPAVQQYSGSRNRIGTFFHSCMDQPGPSCAVDDARTDGIGKSPPSDHFSSGIKPCEELSKKCNKCSISDEELETNSAGKADKEEDVSLADKTNDYFDTLLCSGKSEMESGVLHASGHSILDMFNSSSSNETNEREDGGWVSLSYKGGMGSTESLNHTLSKDIFLGCASYSNDSKSDKSSHGSLPCTKLKHLPDNMHSESSGSLQCGQKQMVESMCETENEQIQLEQKLNTITFTPLSNPPTRGEVLESLSSLGIPEVVNPEPFYGNYLDVKRKKEVGGRVLYVMSYSSVHLEEFTCNVPNVCGLKEQQKKLFLHHWGLSQHNNVINLIPSHASQKQVIVVPVKQPPTVREVRLWDRARKILKMDTQEVKIGERKIKLKIHCPRSPRQTSDTDDDSSCDVSLRSPETPEAVIVSYESLTSHSTPQSTLNVFEMGLTASHRSHSPVLSRDVHGMKGKVPRKKKLQSKRGCLLRSPSVENTKNERCEEDDLGVSVLDVEDVPLSQKLNFVVSTTQDEKSLRRLLLDSQFRQQASSPQMLHATDVSACQIEGLNNTHGFRMVLENLQDARFETEHQHTTVMTMELHINTLGTLKPDPERDSIRAVFYSIVNDVPDTNQHPRQITGVLAVNDQNSGLPLLHHTGVTGVIDYVQDEKALLLRVISLVRTWDPDILAGYEIEMLSWGYLLQRAYRLDLNMVQLLSRVPEQKHQNNREDMDNNSGPSGLRLVGRIVLDVWRLLRSEVALQSYTFENVMYHILHQRVPLHSFQKLSQWWEDKSNHYIWITAQYYQTRVVGVTRLLDQLDIIGRTSELARLFGIQFFEVLSRGSQFRVESMMLRLAKLQNYVPVSPSVQQRARMRAPESLPLIMEPESRFYSDPVIVLDFQSLYPSIIIAYNYCFSTCLGRVEHLGKSTHFEFGCTQLRVSKARLRHLQNHISVAPCGVAFVSAEVRRGILPCMLEEILEARLAVKQSMKRHKDNCTLQRVLHARQLGLKLIANVTYGYTSANFSGRMPCIEVGDSVVSKARETLEQAIALVHHNEQWRARVVYGDTDSLFVLVPGRNRREAFRIGAEIADAVTQANPSPVKLKLEKVYQPSILQTKKRYVGYMYESADQKDPVYDAKGIETVRRDGCPAVSKMLEKSLRLLFETCDVSLVKRYVCRQFSKLLQGRANIQDLIYAREYRGMANYRPGACVPALELTRRWLANDRRAEPRIGERVPYVIVNGSPGLPLIRLVCHPSELLMDPSLRFNAVYYITRAITPPLERCFSLIGVDVFSWFAELPRKQQTMLPVMLNEGLKKSTISQYFSTLGCVCCGKVTQSGVCADCIARPQMLATVLLEKLHNWDGSYIAITKVCQSCLGRQHSLDCVSLDCPILYRQSQSFRDLEQEQHVRKILKDLLPNEYL